MHYIILNTKTCLRLGPAIEFSAEYLLLGPLAASDPTYGILGKVL